VNFLDLSEFVRAVATVSAEAGFNAQGLYPVDVGAKKHFRKMLGRKQCEYYITLFVPAYS